MIRREKLPTGDTKVTFSLPLSEVPEPTSVMGDFNDWDPMTHPLKKRNNGTRSASVELSEGEVVQFRYLSDGGRWFNETEADCNNEGNNFLAA